MIDLPALQAYFDEFEHPDSPGTTWVASRLREDSTNRSNPASVVCGFLGEMRAEKWKRAIRYVRSTRHDSFLASIRLKSDRLNAWSQLGEDVTIRVEGIDESRARLILEESDRTIEIEQVDGEWWVRSWQ